MAKKRRGAGLTPQIFKGLNKKRMEKGGGGFGNRVVLKKGESVAVQFLTMPDDPKGFIEFKQHVWQEDGWTFVPCAGDGCPLCEAEDERQAKTSYVFAANVYNLKEKKVQILVGPKDLAQRIFFRYERLEAKKIGKKFLAKVYEVTKFDSQPVTYGFDLADEERAVDKKGLKLLDLEEYVASEMKRYYGEDLPSTDALEDDEDDDALDDDEELEDELDDDEDIEDEEDEDEEEDEEEDDDLDLDDEDDEEEEDDDDLDLDDDDDDEEWDEDDEDEEEEEEPEPPKKTKRTSKKSSGKTTKAPAKKTTAKKKPAAKKAPARKAPATKKGTRKR